MNKRIYNSLHRIIWIQKTKEVGDSFQIKKKKLVNNIINMNEMNILIAWLVAFLSSIKPWLVWYISLESYKAFKWITFTLKWYVFRFISTLWLLYIVDTFSWKLWEYQTVFVFIVWAFSIVIIDILEKKMPNFLESKANNFINKNK